MLTFFHFFHFLSDILEMIKKIVKEQGCNIEVVLFRNFYNDLKQLNLYKMSMFDLGDEEIKDGNVKSYLKPGLDIPVVLELVELDDKENLKITLFSRAFQNWLKYEA